MINVRKVLGNNYNEWNENILPHIIEMEYDKPQEINKLLDKSISLADNEGWWMEFGTHTGFTGCHIAKRLKELYPHLIDKKLITFDSFEGLPEDWIKGNEDVGKGEFDLNGEIPNILKKTLNILPVKGWFKDSLPNFIKHTFNPNQKISFLHMDADLYSSTKTVFDNLKPYFRGKCVIQFDEFCGYPKAGEEEYKAFYEFLEENKNNILDVKSIGKGGTPNHRPESVSYLITFKNK